MSLLNKGAPAYDKKFSTSAKAKSLNPDAAEFVPFALRSPSGNTSGAETSSSFGPFGGLTPGKAVLNRTESSVSNNSDDEVHQFWRHQLPDDITPDFNAVGEDESLGINSIPFSGLSIADSNGSSRFSASTGTPFMPKERHEISPRVNGSGFAEKMRYPPSAYGENASAANYQQMAAKPWDMNGDQLLAGIIDRPSYNGDSGQGYLDDMLNEQQMEVTEAHSLEFLASQFPGFAAESLAEVFYANGCDLNLTIEMLTQLELQVDNGLNQNLNSKALSAPNLSALDFPALSPTENQNAVPTFSRHDQQQNLNSYPSLEKELLMFKTSPTSPSLGATDFASAVRKMAPQDSSIWKYERNHSPNSTIGSSRSSHSLSSGYGGGNGRSSYGERVTNRSSSRSAPVWLETGDAVANMYSEMRGEARDHARLRNTYFEQTGTYEITTRWTMEMTFSLLPWKPVLVFTGTSVMGINPENGKFCSHVDYWDSLKNNEYFSSEGLVDLVKQLRIYKTPDLETPKYQILKRTATYEVRNYSPFIIVETQSDKLASSTGFNDVAGYIFGKNSREEKIAMTTPVFTQAFDPDMSKMSIQIVIPSDKDMESLPDPNKEDVSLRSVQGGYAAVLKFSGKPMEDIVREKEKLLRSSLLSDGLKPKDGCLLARYNDPGRTKSFMMRNEVLIWLEEFTL